MRGFLHVGPGSNQTKNPARYSGRAMTCFSNNTILLTERVTQVNRKTTYEKVQPRDNFAIAITSRQSEKFCELYRRPLSSIRYAWARRAGTPIFWGK